MIRRTGMQLFSEPECPQCHRIRIVLAEKDANYRVSSIDDPQNREDLALINPDCTTPTFSDLGMVLVEPRIIMEYLDDRHPHPPLMPIDPAGKAQARVWLQAIEDNLYAKLPELRSPGAKKSAAARATMQEFLQDASDHLKRQSNRQFFVSESFTLLDASLLPILWRLEKSYKIKLPQHSILWKYTKVLYQRLSFQISMTELERDIHRD